MRIDGKGNNVVIKFFVEKRSDKEGVIRIDLIEQIFDRVKGRFVNGPYVWKEQLELLNEAVQIFGMGKVSTHIIVGLGETEREMAQILQKCVDMGVLPALFLLKTIYLFLIP